MILTKEFYFVRHGQTDHNIHDGKHKDGHPEDIPLNKTGGNQALAIKLLIALLPVQTVCCSLMKRAQKTKKIIFSLENHGKGIAKKISRTYYFNI